MSSHGQCATTATPSARAVDMHVAMRPLVKHLIGMPQTAGLCVLGSYALTGFRPDADIYSDFDMALFISLDLPCEILALAPLPFQRAVQPYLPDWLPNFKFVYPDGDPLGHVDAPPLQINIHQLVLEYELQDHIVWPSDRREAFANTCDIVYDPHGKIAELRSRKAAPPADELERRINDLLAAIPVTIEHSLEKCIRRNAIADAILSLSEISDYLIDLIYAINSMDLPHRKWRVSMLSKLSLAPANVVQALPQMLSSPSNSIEALEDRMKTLMRLFDEVKEFAEQKYPCPDAYRKLITRTRPGFQLRDFSFADDVLSLREEQYSKMQNRRWNRVNYGLTPDEECAVGPPGVPPLD